MLSTLICLYLYSEPFKVVHQSGKTTIKDENIVPLFCIASNHSLLHVYSWEKVGTGKVGVDSPVLWLNVPGEYRCTVSSVGEQCYTDNIAVVKGMGNEGKAVYGLFRTGYYIILYVYT